MKYHFNTDEKTEYNKNPSITSVTVGILLIIVFVPIILLNIILIIKNLANPGSLPSVFGITAVIESTDLMTGGDPKIKEGDLLFFKTGAADYRTGDDGDIVAIMTGNNIVTVRRLSGVMNMEKGGRKYIAVTESGGETPKIIVQNNQIIGKYTGRMAGMGAIIMSTQNTSVMYIAAALPLYMLFLLWIISYLREKGAKKIPRL